MARLVRPPRLPGPPATSVPATLPEKETQRSVPEHSAAEASSDLNFERMTVVQLRNYLRDYSVHFPFQARKAELVRLASKHRRQASNVKSKDLGSINTQLPDVFIKGFESDPDLTTSDQATLADKPSQPTSTTLTAPADLRQDLSSLKVLQLQQYLQDYGICIPSNARKAELLKIVQEHHARTPNIQAGISITPPVQLSDLFIGGAQTTANPVTSITSTEPTTESITSREVDTIQPLANVPSPTDGIAYLQPGFKPNSLAVPKLRNILAAHEVIYAQARKKEDLVRLFENFIAPRAHITVQAMATIKKTDVGIVNV